MFDVIAAHPPYVPAEETELVFRDGGADGEQITRRIVAGLADHLNPGGLFYLECMLTDRAGEPIEQRVRRMLGPLEEEFDVFVVRGGGADPKSHLADRLSRGSYHRRPTPVKARCSSDSASSDSSRERRSSSVEPRRARWSHAIIRWEGARAPRIFAGSWAI